MDDTPNRRSPTWARLGVVAAVFVLAFVVSKSCQKSDVDLTQDDAVAKATEQVEWTPQDTQVRLLRQGIDRHAFWIVSLSIPSPKGDSYEELAVVRMDAETGEVVEFREQEDAPRGAEQAP